MVTCNEAEVFNIARQIESPQARTAYLDQVCNGDPGLKERIVALLSAHAEQNFLEHPPAELVQTTTEHGTEPPLTEIGPYKLREQIGEGGFGVVYVAEQETPVARKVALKIVKPGMDTSDVIARFEAERQALALMEHPNIARVLDAGATDSGRPYFVMELVYGVPITQFCDEQKLTNRERLALFLDVCRATQHAHQKGIIHRDLKPSNILVTMHDDTPVPKVIDFGVAKALSQRLTDKTVYTSYGQMVGTPLYMSPEQAQMSGLDVDTRSDIYSLGVLLYELLTGTTPFDKKTLTEAGFDELRRIIREDDPPRPSARVSTWNLEKLSTAADRRKVDGRRLTQSLRGELDWIVMKALEKNRGRRYETASQLAEDIEHYLVDEPVVACPPSLGYRFGKFARRNRVALTTSSLIAIAMIAGTIASVSQAVRASASEDAAVTNAEQARESERIAQEERDAAVDAREKLRRVLYASEMNLIQTAWDSNDYRRVMQLLDGTRPQEGETDLRGFEWHYWNRQLHGPLERDIVDVPLLGSTRNLKLSPDGSRLAIHYYDQGEDFVSIWDIANRRQICNFETKLVPRFGRPTGWMVFSPDGKRLAIAEDPRRGDKGLLSVWNTDTGERLFQAEDDVIKVGSLLFSQDGNRVFHATSRYMGDRAPRHARYENGYKVWDIEAKRAVVTYIYEQDQRVAPLFLSHDGKQLYVTERKVGAGGETLQGWHLQIWDVETAEVLQDRELGDLGDFYFRGRSQDGSEILISNTADQGQLTYLDAQSLEIVLTLNTEQSPPRAGGSALSPNGRFLAISTSDHQVLLWDLSEVADDGTQEPERPEVPALALRVPVSGVELRFSSDSQELRACMQNRVWSWKLPTASTSGANRDWSHVVLRGSFNSDGTRAVLTVKAPDANMIQTVLAWDVGADRELWRYDTIKDHRLRSPVFSPDGRFVVVQNFKKDRDSRPPVTQNLKLLLLDSDTGREIRTFAPEENALFIWHTVFNPAGTHVAALVGYDSGFAHNPY